MMATLHPAETALRQATTTAKQAVAEETALVHHDTSKVKIAAITRQEFSLSSSCHAGGDLISASSSKKKTATSPVTNSQPY